MMLPEICIKRPVFATVLSLIILLIGLISYTRLSVREYPRIDEPVVSVSVTYRGASAEVVESQVTKPLEDSLAGIEGVEVMTSQSRSETTRINVRFTLKRDPDSAAADVRDKVARARGKLPDTIDEPIIAKVEADSQPIDLHRRRRPGSLTPLEASDYVKRYVQPRLSVLPGAADVRIFGERQMSMRINLDRTRLAAYKLTVQDVEDALRRQNAEIPAGRIESKSREFTVVAETDLRTPEQFNSIIVANVGGYPVRIRDVGSAEIGAIDERDDLALQRQAVAQHRRDQAGGGESARAVEGGARRGRPDQRRPAAGHEARRRLRHVVVHRPLDQVGVRDDRRGDPAGRAGHLLLPAQPARDADPDRHDPGRR